VSTNEVHSLYSSRREKILENLFIGEVLRELWRRGVYEADILQSDIDASGYDVVLDFEGGTRHIQLKVKKKNGRWAIGANGKIGDRADGCVVVMEIDSVSLEFLGFHWLGKPIGSGGIDISDGRAVKHARVNAEGQKKERRNSYKIPKNLCDYLPTISDVVNRLVEIS